MEEIPHHSVEIAIPDPAHYCHLQVPLSRVFTRLREVTPFETAASVLYQKHDGQGIGDMEVLIADRTPLGPLAFEFPMGDYPDCNVYVPSASITATFMSDLLALLGLTHHYVVSAYFDKHRPIEPA